jgi:hypothetical protein
MSDKTITIHAELDKLAVTAMMHAAEVEAGLLQIPQPQKGTSGLGPFSVNWDVEGSLKKDSGDFVLKSPNIFGLKDVGLNYTLSAGFTVDLSQFIPLLPKLPVSFSYSDTIPISGDFSLNPQQSSDGKQWTIRLIVVDALSIPVQATGKFIDTLTDALTAGLKALPGIGDALNFLLGKILDLIGADAALNFLAQILSDLVSGFPLITLQNPTVLRPDLPAKYKVSAEVDLQIKDLSSLVTADTEVLILTGVGVLELKAQDVNQEMNLHLQLSGEDTMLLGLPGA